jgi:hypothetical protein
MSGKVVLTGGLKFTSLADLFQIIGGNNSTGTLRITSQYTPNPGIVYFVEGNPVNATDGNLRGLNAIFGLFGRTEGDFEFVEGKVAVERAIKKSRMEIVLDALRMIDDGVIKKIEPPSTQEIFVGKTGNEEETKKSGTAAITGPAIDYLYILEEEDFHDGKTIVKEGTHGKWIWVLLEGMAKISKETQRGPLTILHLGEGCYIGTFSSLLFHDYARTATVKAVGDARLGLLDTQRLAGEFYTLPNDQLGPPVEKHNGQSGRSSREKAGNTGPDQRSGGRGSGRFQEGTGLSDHRRQGLCNREDTEGTCPSPGTGKRRRFRLCPVHGHGPGIQVRFGCRPE